MEEYDFEKLAREIVASRLAEIKAAPQVAAEIARKIIVQGVQSTKVRQDPHLTVAAVCRGVMGGMLMLDKDLAETAVRVLKSMAEIALEVHLDPTDLMTWGMEGIAAVCHLAAGSVHAEVQQAIEQEFHGVGPIFSDLYERETAK